MLSISEVRQRLAVVVPVYFEPSVPRETILPILEGVFRDSEIFCRADFSFYLVFIQNNPGTIRGAGFQCKLSP